MKQAGHIAASLLSVVLAHHAALLPHEYAHSFMAWALGYKSDPLVIHWGVRRVTDVILLIDIDQRVDYAAMYARGDGFAAVLVGFAGPGLANGALYLVSLWLLQRPRVRSSTLLFTFVFWFNFMNLGNFFDYVPIRTFAPTGDMADIARGLGVSPWVVLIVLGIPTATAMWFFFARTLPMALGRITASSSERGMIVTVSVAIMFGYFGLSGIEGYGRTSHILSLLSLCLIPVMLILCWPTRRWMRARIEAAW
ncbi:hypothetical protein [Reyranella soli]|uniref:Peptidase M50 domain-containing protein n=1 Tax=Reyranella soli TaxID=1230389 RepID=A0A512NQL1_9HYPH|nr:hypothetical protein [Reyranella soli]GEP61236.1 hypothetical protein RSO01_84020 [Reyranella soli]